APGLRQLCEPLRSEQFLNSAAARGPASIDDPAMCAKLVNAYRQFQPSERGQLLSALVSRATFAQPLLDAVAEGKMPRADISPYHADRKSTRLNSSHDQISYAVFCLKKKKKKK